MATLLGDFFGRRRPGFTGRLMIDQVRGVTRVRAWPKKRGKVKSPLQQFWVDWFKGANLLAKYASAADIRRSIEMSKGSGRYPRDILLMAMRGRLLWWTVEGEGKWFPVAAISDISDTLDVLAQKVGNILVRAGDRWRAPTDGNEGDVLTFHPSAPPDWQPSAGGGGGAFAGALATRTANFNVAPNTPTIMPWQVEQYDSDNFMDIGVSASRFTIPAGFSFCRLTCNIRWESKNTGQREVEFRKNGVTFPGGGNEKIAQSGSATHINVHSAVVPCIEGDYFEAQVHHNHSTSMNILNPNWITFFSIQAFPD